MVLYEEPRSHAIMNVTAELLSQVPEHDAKFVVVNSLADGDLPLGGGRTSRDLWSTLDDRLVQLCTEFSLLCDAMLVRSYTEYARLLTLCKKRRPRVQAVVVEPGVPHVERRSPLRPSVVVWAPDRPSLNIAYHAHALNEFRGDVTCVTSDGTPPAEGPARFVTPSDPHVPEALAVATCVVCVEPEDPGPAVAFARLGYGVVAPLTSGAHEFVSDVVTYDFTATRELHVAVSIAIAQPASPRELPKPPRAPRRPALPGPPESLPLVSVVTPTYNRRRDLERMLGALARQTYPRIEAVIVNDGGENVDDVVARFPFARTINVEHVGVLRAVIAGINAVSGAYIQLIADDDWLQPDHIESLVGAMLRSGASVAHGNTLIRHQERDDDGSFSTVGFTTTIFNETATPTEALIATPIAGNSMIVRRDVLAEIGSWREDFILHDQEFHLRAAGRYAFAYVDRMTAEFRSRGKYQYSNTADSGPDLRRLYDELHPVSGRPFVQNRREQALANLANRAKDQPHAFPPTLEIAPVKAPALSDGPYIG